MTKPETIEVLDSFSLTFFGIVAELKHQLNGLPPGLVIRSPNSEQEWHIKERILYSHTQGQQKKFSNEITSYMRPSFHDFNSMLSSARNILDREAENIFQYQLEAICHSSKPEKGETLIVSFE